jgi:hypothetical protein
MEETEELSDISVDSNLEWELEEGIPQIEDPFIQKYMQGRDALIEQEKRKRHGISCCCHVCSLQHGPYTSSLITFLSCSY